MTAPYHPHITPCCYIVAHNFNTGWEIGYIKRLPTSRERYLVKYPSSQYAWKCDLLPANRDLEADNLWVEIMHKETPAGREAMMLVASNEYKAKQRSKRNADGKGTKKVKRRDKNSN